MLELGWPLLRAASVDSTMRWARTSLEEGTAGPGAVFVAASQTAGRGRRGRAWLSLPGKGLYLTAVLPGTLAEPAVTLAAAVALAEAAERACGVRSEVKWPNDLLLEGMKWAGLLAEAVAQRGGDAVLLGIGANLNHRAADFEPELSGRATSLAIASGSPVDSEVMLTLVIERLEERLGAFEKGGFAAVADLYRRRAAFAPGDQLEVELPGQPARRLTLRGLDEDGRLLAEEFPEPLSVAAAISVRRRAGT